MSAYMVRFAAASLATCVLVVPIAARAADERPAPPPTPYQRPAASAFYPFLGFWRGDAQISEAGQPRVELSLTLSCRKASSGWAVRCDMVGRGETLTLVEADLMGVDPASGAGHWFVVNNLGETRDHRAEWLDRRTLRTQYAWAQDGKQMLQSSSYLFIGEHRLDIRRVTSADGREVSVFAARLGR